MLKKEITYVDYNGNERKEPFYFNLNKAELMEMELSINGGLSALITKVVEGQDMPTLISIFKDLILKAYGEKSADGKYFLKTDENGHRLANKFAQTEAFSVLFMELATSDVAAANFINGITPPEESK